MMVVVRSDRYRKGKEEAVVNFEKIGRKMLDTVNGKTIIKRYGKLDGEAFGKKLKEERINFLKNYTKFTNVIDFWQKKI